MNSSIARSALLGAALAATAIFIASCGPRQGAGADVPAEARAGSFNLESGSRMRMQGGYGSPAALAQAVLDAFAATDTTTLLKLMVNRQEFDRYIYPELGTHYPAARDTSELARQFVWQNQYFGALKGMKKALRELGGKRMTLVAVTFRDGTEGYATYKVHVGTEVKVKLEDGGEADLLALGSMVEMDGRYKLLSYRDREE